MVEQHLFSFVIVVVDAVKKLTCNAVAVAVIVVVVVTNLGIDKRPWEYVHLIIPQQRLKGATESNDPNEVSITSPLDSLMLVS